MLESLDLGLEPISTWMDSLIAFVGLSLDPRPVSMGLEPVYSGASLKPGSTVADLVLEQTWSLSLQGLDMC